ncbi:4534_t:CDS:2 [Cetraspora pellucida]|uniref:4534_t:CDS:1 n=1 Tax=Cetraspora pellucida TaxID=1433469 RepID=A0A9N9H474_9GLOM|nr:4534_t:CDS:2 [Cetraspora pellucida]
MVENNGIDINVSNVSKPDCIKEAIGTAETVSTAVSAFAPIAVVATAILKLCEEMCDIHKKAQCNEEMCGILLDQVQLAEYPIKKLLRKKDASLDKEYCDNLIKFRQTLEKMKNFAKQVSQLGSFKKFISGNNVKENFDNLSKEFDTRMKFLNFSTLIYNEEQRIIDQQRVDDELNRIQDWLAKLSDQVDTKLQFAAEMMNRTGDKSDFKPTNIDPNLLQDLNVNTRSGKVVKKKYISQQTEVACKPIDLVGQSQSLLAILEMLSDCDYFLKFYGMTKYYQPKIANFEFSRSVTSNISMDIGNRILEVIRWLAPEKIRNSEVPYSQKCEVFSFGMLLWELSFEKIPYKDLDLKNIMKYVQNGGREKITFGQVISQQERVIQKEFENIIKGAWHQDPDQRPSIMILFESLKKLAKDDPPVVFDDNTLDLDGSFSQDEDLLTQEFEDINFDNFGSEILPFDEGIRLHKKETNENAQVFYALAKDVRPKERKELIKYLTMAADNGNRDALFNLGNALYKREFEKGLKYMKLAAYKGHPKAIEKVKVIDKRDR